MRFKVKSFLPVLLALSFVSLIGLHVLLLVMYWLGMSIGNEFEGLYLLLWQLAAGTTVIAAVLVLVRPRWIAWSLLVLSYSLSAVLTVIRAQEAAQERREMDQRLAPERLAENRLYLESALIKADCANGVTLTLNRHEISNGGSVLRVMEIPSDLTRQNRSLVYLNNTAEAEISIRDLSKGRPRLESYKSQSEHSCQQQIDAMVMQLDSFARSKGQPRNG